MNAADLLQVFLDTFFTDRYCGECRCGAEHHLLQREPAEEEIFLHCTYHKQECGSLHMEAAL